MTAGVESAGGAPSSPPARRRYDTFVIWGHGVEHVDEILALLRADPDFRILRIEEHRPRNLAAFVRRVYRCDTVPLEHLRAKTRYLLGTPRSAIFVFVENRNVRERPVGDGAFRHLQCETVVAFKNAIRERFNPRREGQRSEEHVIHGTDQAHQTDYLLKLLGHRDGVAMFETSGCGLLAEVPYHIERPRRALFTHLPMGALRAAILTGGRGRRPPVLELVEVKSTPHYRAFDDIRPYVEYLSRYRFRYLVDDHNPASLLALGTLSPAELFALGRVIVEKLAPAQYRVLDGVHRLAALARHGVESVPCVELA